MRSAESNIFKQTEVLTAQYTVATRSTYEPPTLTQELVRVADKKPRLYQDIVNLHTFSLAYAEFFASAWEDPLETDPQDLTTVYERLGLENSYLTGFARLTVAMEFINHKISPNRVGTASSLERYGIDLKKEQSGMFNPTEDMIGIEERFMRSYVEQVKEKILDKETAREERESLQITLGAWIDEFEHRYGEKPSFYKKLKLPVTLDTRSNGQKTKDLPKSFKDLFVNNFYDENATIGHVINSMGGWYLMTQYLHLFGEKTRGGVQLSAMGGFLALVFIGSLNLPNRAVDKETEKWASKVLTFAPTVGVGLVSGLIAPNPASLGVIAPLLATILAGGTAYWYQGQMSRRELRTDFQNKGIFTRYPAIGDFVAKVGNPGYHVRVDSYLRNLSSKDDYWKAVKRARYAGEAIDSPEAEIQQVLADTRTFLNVDTRELAIA